jgi:Na+/H+ antiporter NhaC
MINPDNLFMVLGWVMVACVVTFFLSDSRIKWERVAKKISMFLAIGIVMLFISFLALHFVSTWKE